MGERAIPTPEERGVARDLAEHILRGVRDNEPGVGARSREEIWLLAATLVFYCPILEAAWKVARHWHEQEGVNAALLDELAESIYG